MNAPTPASKGDDRSRSPVANSAGVTRLYVALAGFGVLTIGASYWAYLNSLSLPTDRAGALSLALAIAGVFVSVGGFGLTLWQLARTRTATEAVQMTVQKIKRDFGSFDILLEVRTARHAAAEAESHIRDKRWDRALLSYNKIRSSLVTILAIRDGLGSIDQETAKDQVAGILDVCRALDGITEHKANRLNQASMNADLRILDSFLTRIEYTVKDSFSDR